MNNLLKMYIEKLKELQYAESRYFKIYENIVVRAKLRLSTHDKKSAKILLGYVEKHHIYPNCVCSATEAKDKHNLVFLTAKEHYIVHLLLPKFLKEGDLRNKMLSAAYLLGNVKFVIQQKNSKMYENLRAQAALQSSIQKKNKPSSLKGKSYEDIHGHENAKLLRIKRGETTKGRIVSEETKNKMRKNHADFSGQNGTTAKNGKFYDNLNNLLFEFGCVNELETYCRQIGFPFRGLKTNNWKYTPNVTSRNINFAKFFGFYVIFL